MPIYEYHCQQCDQDFEKMVRLSEAGQNPPCPSCGSRDTRKQMSAVAAHSTGAALSSGGQSCSSSRGSSPFR